MDNSEQFGQLKIQVAELSKELKTIKSIPSTHIPDARQRSHSTTQQRVLGGGDDIGITRLYHIAVSRIPANSIYTPDWLKATIQAKFNDLGATVRSCELLKSDNPERRSTTQAFKVSIAYDGEVNDLYTNSYFPKNSLVKRFNFPKRPRLETINAIANPAPPPTNT